jgi:hypothetical protein
MRAYQVWYGEKHLDTVFFAKYVTAEEVRLALINHDGYPLGIQVRLAP